MKIGLFAGSFDPFTNGHYEIAKKALKICDKLLICIGDNERKKRTYDKSKMISAINQTFTKEIECNKIEVYEYSGLTGDFAIKANANFLIRGIRDVKDYINEEEIASFNLKAFNLETIYLRAEPNAQHISSSIIRERLKNNLDVIPYLPAPVLNAIKLIECK